MRRSRETATGWRSATTTSHHRRPLFHSGGHPADRGPQGDDRPVAQARASSVPVVVADDRGLRDCPGTLGAGRQRTRLTRRSGSHGLAGSQTCSRPERVSLWSPRPRLRLTEAELRQEPMLAVADVSRAPAGASRRTPRGPNALPASVASHDPHQGAEGQRSCRCLDLLVATEVCRVITESPGRMTLRAPVTPLH